MKCPYCGSEKLRKRGFSKKGAQRYLCKDCAKTFTEGISIKEKEVHECPHCHSTNSKKGGVLASGGKRYVCKDCGRNFSERTIIREEIPDSVKCPDCGSHSLKRSGKSKFGVQRYVCKDCGRKFVEVVRIRPATTHQVTCPVCGNNFAQKAGHTGSGSQYWKCVGCGHKFLEDPRFKRVTEKEKQEIFLGVNKGLTLKEISKKIGKTSRTIRNILLRVNPNLLEVLKENLKKKGEEIKREKLVNLAMMKAEKKAKERENLSKIKERAINLFQVEGLPQKEVARTLGVSLDRVRSMCKGELSRDRLRLKNIREAILKGKPLKRVAEEYNYNVYSLNKMMKPYYKKEEITKEQKALIIKYGVFLKVPVDYLAEYVPCSEKKCSDIIKEYLEGIKRNENSKI